MGEIRQSSKFLKRCIEDTLFILLNKKPYKEIDVKQLCDKACVGRTSFYRYFKDLDDVILYSFIRMWNEWCDMHNVKIRDKFTLDNAETFFEYNYSIKSRLDLVYKNNLENIILKSFELIMKEDSEHNYQSRFYGYGLFSMLKEWWLRDFKETPKEIANIIIDIVKKGNI